MSTLSGQGTAGTGGAPVPASPPGARENPPGTPHRGRRMPGRKGWALAGLILAVAVVAAAVTGISAVVSHHPRAAASHPLRDTVFRFRPGQCLNSAPNGIGHVHALPCAQPHDAEIFGAFRVAGHRWPGTAALAAQAHTGCLRRLHSYLNPQLATTGLAVSYIYPDLGAWGRGERTVICEIRGTHGKLTGSVRAFTAPNG